MGNKIKQPNFQALEIKGITCSYILSLGLGGVILLCVLIETGNETGTLMLMRH